MCVFQGCPGVDGTYIGASTCLTSSSKGAVYNGSHGYRGWCYPMLVFGGPSRPVLDGCWCTGVGAQEYMCTRLQDYLIDTAFFVLVSSHDGLLHCSPRTLGRGQAEEAKADTGIAYLVPVLAGLGKEGVRLELPALLQASQSDFYALEMRGHVSVGRMRERRMRGGEGACVVAQV